MLNPGKPFAVCLIAACILLSTQPAGATEGAGMPDHGIWSALLAAFVEHGEDGIARVDYARWVRKPEDLARLDAYLASLQSVLLANLPAKAQLAYWINLYNALTVRIILRHYPVASIRDIDISPGLFADGPWGHRAILVEGAMLSLDDIEHKIIRARWHDPRIHYALNCASIGCPNLADEAYTQDTLDRLLEAGAWAYVNHPRGVDVHDGTATLSKIYSWYREDFGGSDESVIAHLRHYAAPALKKALGSVERISGYRYDWSLNDAEAPLRVELSGSSASHGGTDGW